MNKSIMIVGVGGQGTLLASRIIGNLAINLGYDCKVSEVHGMSQRGGSVITYVRFGDKIESPIIDKGCADVVLAFEKLEAYRALPYLKKDGIMIVNDTEIEPMPVIIGAMEYPLNITKKLEEKTKIVKLDCLRLSLEVGNTKTQNVVLLGAFAKTLGIDQEEWIKVIKTTVKEKLVDVNISAFLKGYNNN